MNPSLREIDLLTNTQPDYHTHHEKNLPYKVYSYKRENLREHFFKFTQLTRAFQRQSVDGPTPECVSVEDLNEILHVLKIDSQATSEGILIPFDQQDLNLGMFIVWGDGKSKRKKAPFNDIRYLGWLASLYSFLRNQFIREFEILDVRHTYLPSLYASRWKKAAILFADIKNFLPLEERLRQTYARDETNTRHVREILNRHCMEMSRIVTGSKGRIERFFGTGLLAIFGEHDEEYSRAAASAVYAATQMINKFEEMKPNLLRQTVCEDYEIEYNHHVNVNLAVGIDFGTVLFEYLGDDHHQKFTAVGDHVNMAEHLMNQAAVYGRQGSRYLPILFSPTVERLTIPWIDSDKKQFEKIYDQRTGLTFPTYRIEPDGFDIELFQKCMDDKNGITWNDAWKGWPRPY
ncbi:MAG TPA: adenylate/guanylate cyclase domain-containing protein [Anaerolineales bacterium]|nr:adenylate/guanylate cyclase domain-containing protein [Anaerolineales bacterium]